MAVSQTSALGRRCFLRMAGPATAAGLLTSCGSRSSGDSPWRFFTAAECKTLAALCDQIIPPDQTAGAAWAGAVNYIDRQLMGPLRRQRTRYRTGLAEMDRSCNAAFGKGFADLDPDSQRQFLAQLEGDGKRFFDLAIAHTMQSYYGDPRHGGNRDAVSWRMLGVSVIPIRGRDQYEFPKQGV